MVTNEDERDLETGGGGQLIPFPTRPVDDLAPDGHQPGVELATRDTSDVKKSTAAEVVDFEFVDEPGTAVDTAPGTAVGPVRRVMQPVVTVVMPVVVVVRTVRQHEPTVRASKWAVRNLVLLGIGLGVVLKKWHDRRSGAIYYRQMLAAEAVGDQERLKDWDDRADRHANRRDRRTAAWLEMPDKLARSLWKAALYSLGLLLLAGILYGVVRQDIRVVLDPLFGTVRLVVSVVAAAVFLAVPLAWLAATVAVCVLWHAGRKYGTVPRWVAPAASRTDRDDVPITPSIVVTAFRDLGLAELRKAIVKMGDAGAGMLGPITMAGCGVEVDVTLPSGTSIQEIQKRHAKLAGNLYRHGHEVFITIPKAARTIRLWIADSGALDEPIGPSPLVTDPDATADVYTGRAPWGENLRGERVALSLLQRHLLITGLSNQGKTAALRALVLWLILDPTVELRIADLKGIGDWRMFSPVATVMIQGPTDTHVIAATEMLEAGVREMNRRTAAVEATGATDGVTRDMARSGQGFHPLFLLVDEAQVAYMCPAKDEDGQPYGGQSNKSRYFMAARQLHNQGRAVNVQLWQGTQDPTNQNLPVLVREGAHIRASLVLSTESQSRMAVGDKAVNGGAAPHKLRQGLDKGTLVVAGDGVDIPDGQPSITTRTHYIDGASATEFVQRVVARRGPVQAVAEIGTGSRDLLADVGEVLGRESMSSADVARRLATTFPDWLPYQQPRMTGVLLVQLLAKEGAKVPTTGNRRLVSPKLIEEARARRPS